MGVKVPIPTCPLAARGEAPRVTPLVISVRFVLAGAWISGHSATEVMFAVPMATTELLVSVSCLAAITVCNAAPLTFNWSFSGSVALRLIGTSMHVSCFGLAVCNPETNLKII